MLATAPLPFVVTRFENRRTGSVSWRVTGSGAKHGRVRKNYGLSRGGEAAARAECDRLNADEIRHVQSMPQVRALPTRLAESDVMMAELTLKRAKDRWTLPEILEAGLQTLETKPPAVEIAGLFAEFKGLAEAELGSGRWKDDVIKTTQRFLDAHAGLTSLTWSQPLTRQWLDGLGVKGQTKANYRNALRRFSRWVCERLGLKDNPVGGLWISRAQDRVGLPVVFTVNQARTMVECCQEDPVCRPLLGWLALTLFAGLRPESEAPALRWTQVRWREREIILRGNKRGSRPRIVKIQPAAYELLRLAKDESPDRPGYFTRGLVKRLVRVTNEALKAKRELVLPQGQDINRHTYASMRAAVGVSLQDLAREMGNDTGTLYQHYLQPVAEREALRFWAIRPKS